MWQGFSGCCFTKLGYMRVLAGHYEKQIMGHYMLFMPLLNFFALTEN